MLKTVLQLVILTRWLSAECASDIVILSHTPVVFESRVTSLVCIDMSGSRPKDSFSIRRQFRWIDSTTAEPSTTRSVWNETALLHEWFGNETDNAIGGFGCGTGAGAVSVFKMKSSGTLTPEEFSVTSSIGDKVVIRMLSKNSHQLGGVLWYKDGHILDLRENPRIWDIDGGRSLVISSIIEGDSGTYMAHYAREEKIQAAATILHVRKCSELSWSADCTQRCPVCENGGSCNEISGECICLPGFRGQHCEIACLPSHFGHECEYQCADAGMGGTTCSGIQLCSTSGCFCFNGWGGSDCTEACALNYHGSGCKERCDCINGGSCDLYQGCICTAGFSGTFCEISQNGSDSTVVASFSPELTPGSTETLPVITEIVADPSWMVNERQRVKINCSVSGNPSPGHGGIILKWHSGQTIEPTTTKMFSARTTTSTFEHDMTTYAGPFWCVAKTSAGQTKKEFNFTIPVKPKPMNPPEALKKQPKFLRLKLNSYPFKGDGPIVRKFLLYKKTRTALPFETFQGPIENDTVILRDLDPYTDYTFRLLLAREGSHGMGYPGPEAVIRTFCDFPRRAPTIQSIYARNDTILFVSWKLPPAADIRGEVTGYQINYRLLGEDPKWTWITLAYSDESSTTVANLIPLGVYSVRIRLRNCAGYSPDSKEVRVTMGRLEKPAGPDIRSVNITSRTAYFSWAPPHNARPYTISGYEISLREMNSNGESTKRNVSDVEFVTRDLAPYTKYRFKVRAYNHEGPGNYSDEETFRTDEAAPTNPSNFSVTQITVSSIQLSWGTPVRPNGIIRGYELNYTSQGQPWRAVQLGRVNEYTVQNLKEFYEYEFKVRAITIEPGEWTAAVLQKTMSSSPLEPPRIIAVSNQSPKSVLFRWEPPHPSEYVHQIVYYKVSYTDDMRQNIEHWDSKLVQGNDTSTIVEDLRSDTVYLFAIAAVTLKIGPFTEQRTFRTDSLTTPPRPDVYCYNITSDRVTVAWKVSKGYDVSNVGLKWKSVSSNDWNLLHFTNDAKSVTLDTLEHNTNYNVELIAYNSEGQSPPGTTTFLTQNSGDGTIGLRERIIIGISSFVVICVIMTAICCLASRNRRRKRSDAEYYGHEMSRRHEIKRQSTIGSSFNAGAITSRSMTLLSNHSSHSMNSKAASNCEGQLTLPEHMILSWGSIFFEDETPGEGNFGQVVKAIIQLDEKCIVAAVKTLKDGGSLDDRKDFLAELDMMVRLGKHPNIISLIGACEHHSDVYLCTEFAPNGNLLQFLRKSRKSGGESTYTYLTQGQLLQFALDICQGMSYLSERELIHRDLAARNVLLSADLTCKIADFGLSRGEGVYVKKTSARLPIRWMAIESLNYNVYTTQSDVWSFGVVLWEIVSLGGTPYYGMSCAELYDKLPKGYRMEQPLNCDAEIYKVMCLCWKDRPHERPSFPQLSVALRRMIDERTDINYVNTAVFDNFSFFKIDANEEEED